LYPDVSIITWKGLCKQIGDVKYALYKIAARNSLFIASFNSAIRLELLYYFVIAYNCIGKLAVRY